jgi:hypothetical protein
MLFFDKKAQKLLFPENKFNLIKKDFINAPHVKIGSLGQRQSLTLVPGGQALTRHNLEP